MYIFTNNLIIRPKMKRRIQAFHGNDIIFNKEDWITIHVLLFFIDFTIK